MLGGAFAEEERGAAADAPCPLLQLRLPPGQPASSPSRGTAAPAGSLLALSFAFVPATTRRAESEVQYVGSVTFT